MFHKNSFIDAATHLETFECDELIRYVERNSKAYKRADWYHRLMALEVIQSLIADGTFVCVGARSVEKVAGSITVGRYKLNSI